MTKQIVYKPRILLPQNCDYNKWAVVACDQYTSDKNYWAQIDALVGDAPSALRLILPECYLDEKDVLAREEAILDTMRVYYANGLFREIHAFVSTRRTFASGAVRKGLVAAVDLEAYAFEAGNKAYIRATEGTVASRLPSRIQIRESSLLELPHIMLLIDDPNDIVFSAVVKAEGETLYDFALNGGGGYLSGRAVRNAAAVRNAFDALLGDMRARYGENLLMLAGDGNHSLAAAKKCYEKAKAENSDTAELKRYALCEIVNLYDDGLQFEPIHRAVFGVNPDAFAAQLQSESQGFSVSATLCGGGKTYPFALPADTVTAVAFVQAFSERYVAEHGGVIDYIHGEDELARLSAEPDCVTIAFAAIDKSGFTEYIIKNGLLPKKTFSMGQACEKRYYLEARRIGNIM